MKRNPFILLLVVTLLALILRVFKITEIPPGLYWDEAANGYAAYSIQMTGADEWGTPLPLLFRSLNDYKPPAFIYLISVFQKFLGPTELSVRLPAAVIGTLSLPAIYLLATELGYILFKTLKSRRIFALISAFLLGTSMWHLQFTRAGFEAGLGLLAALSGLAFFLRALRVNPIFFFPSGLSFVLGIYSFHAARIFIPLLVLFLGLLFLKRLLPPSKSLLLSIALSLLVLLPFLPTFVSPEGRARLKSEGLDPRNGSVVYQFQQNLIANFDMEYLFFRGDQNGRHSVKKLGQFYLWQLPFILSGLYLLSRKSPRLSLVLVLWAILAAVPPAITKVSPHAQRGFLMIPPFLIFASYGIVTFTSRLKILSVLSLPLILAFALFSYLHQYYIHYPKAYAADWQNGAKETVDFLEKRKGNYRQFFIHPSLDPIHVLFYSKFDPATFQKNNHDVSRIGQYTYHDLNTAPPKDDATAPTLIVAPPWAVGPNVSVLREIRDIGGQPLFEIYEY